MGLFKGMKDMAELTKNADKLRKQQQKDAGYGTGMGGAFKQMGDQMGQANEMLKEMSDQGGDRDRLLAEGDRGTGTIIGMGTPERGANWFNLSLDLEVAVKGRKKYKIKQQYLVPAAAQLGPGAELPIAVDPEDPKKIAIDWNQVSTGPAEGEIRPA